MIITWLGFLGKKWVYLNEILFKKCVLAVRLIIGQEGHCRLYYF